MLPDIAAQSHGRRFQNESVLRGYRSNLKKQQLGSRSLTSSMVFEDAGSKLLLRADGRYAHTTRDAAGVRGTTEGTYGVEDDHVELRAQYHFERDSGKTGVEDIRSDQRVVHASLAAEDGQSSLKVGDQVLSLARAEPALRKVQSNPELRKSRHPSGIPAGPGHTLPRIEAAQREKPNVSKWLDRLLAESRRIQRELAANRAAVSEMRDSIHEEYRLAGHEEAASEPEMADDDPMHPLRLTAEVEYHEQELS